MHFWQQVRADVPNALEHMRHLDRQTLIDDLIAGATGAVAGAPQAMGFAIVAGVSPVYGLYTAIVTTIVGALTSSSTLMTIAPTNALALVVGTTLVRFDAASQIERMITLTLLVGVFQLAFGLLHLGELTRFVSNAVMTGFITGAMLLIILGQLPHMTGVPTHGGGVLPRLWHWLENLDQLDAETTVIGVAAFIIIYRLHVTRLGNVATLIAILITGITVAVAGWDHVELVRDLSRMPSGLPSPTVPNLSYAPDLLVAALALAVLGSVQSAAITNMFADSKHRKGNPPDVNRDFVAQGLANIAGGFFQNMAAAGSFSRTAVNVNARARTRLANVLAGVFVALFVVALAPLIERVALAALAGHLIVAAMTVMRPRMIWMVWKVNASARVSMAVTFLSTLVLPLEYSIYIGVGLSLGLYAYTSASNIQVSRLIPMGDQHFRETDIPAELPSREPVVLSVSGNMYFAAVKRLEELMPSPVNAERPVVILRLRDNQYLGSTGLRFLEQYSQQLRERGGMLILTGVGPKIERELKRTAHLDYFGENGVFTAEDQVFDATEHALNYVQKWLAEKDKP
jgi:SulP family sulfate permease